MTVDLRGAMRSFAIGVCVMTTYLGQLADVVVLLAAGRTDAGPAPPTVTAWGPANRR